MNQLPLSPVPLRPRVLRRGERHGLTAKKGSENASERQGSQSHLPLYDRLAVALAVALATASVTASNMPQLLEPEGASRPGAVSKPQTPEVIRATMLEGGPYICRVPVEALTGRRRRRAGRGEHCAALAARLAVVVDRVLR